LNRNNIKNPKKIKEVIPYIPDKDKIPKAPTLPYILPELPRES